MSVAAVIKRQTETFSLSEAQECHHSARVRLGWDISTLLRLGNSAIRSPSAPSVSLSAAKIEGTGCHEQPCETTTSSTTGHIWICDILIRDGCGTLLTCAVLDMLLECILKWHHNRQYPRFYINENRHQNDDWCCSGLIVMHMLISNPDPFAALHTAS